MLRYVLTGITGASLMLAGCQALLPAASSGQLTTSPAGQKATGRALAFVVNAPNALGANGKILNSDVAGVVAAGGGNVVAAGGGNVVAAGGGNVIAAGGGNYRIAASLDAYSGVEKAVLHLENAKGERMTPFFETGAGGQISLSGVPDGTHLYAVARFKANGTIYRVATPISKGTDGATFYLDPINAMVTARVREIVARDGQAAGAVTLEKLKEVWTICNDANVEVDLAMLDAARTWKDIGGFYQTLLPQISDTAKRQVVADFLGTLK